MAKLLSFAPLTDLDKQIRAAENQCDVSTIQAAKSRAASDAGLLELLAMQRELGIHETLEHLKARLLAKSQPHLAPMPEKLTEEEQCAIDHAWHG